MLPIQPGGLALGWCYQHLSGAICFMKLLWGIITDIGCISQPSWAVSDFGLRPGFRSMEAYSITAASVVTQFLPIFTPQT